MEKFLTSLVQFNNIFSATEDLVIKEDINELKELISNHYKYTKSTVAEKILLNWKKEVKHFSKVMPTDYKRVLQEMDQKKLKAS